MFRKPLEKGHEIIMPNGGKYYIEELVGAGGFSLTYLASTQGGKSDVVIKEYFPAETVTGEEIAYRDENPESISYKKVCPREGQKDNF